MTDQKYTLMESVEAMNRLTMTVADLLAVVIIDCQDEWGDSDIDGEVFSVRKDNGFDETTDYAKHFAQMLVTRLLYEQEVRIELVAVPEGGGE